MCYTVNTYLNANQLEVLTGKKMSPSAQPSISRKSNGFDQPKLALTSQLDPSQIDTLPWGLIPHWVNNPDEAKKLSTNCLNARSESLAEKPSFRDSLETLRAVIWVRGFYEYRTEGTQKLPYFIENAHSDVLPLAGLISLNPQFGSTCTIVTSEANSQMKFIHTTKERMPVVLPGGDIEAWINPEITFAEVETLLKPCPSKELKYLALNPVVFKKKGTYTDPLTIPKGPSFTQTSLF